MASQTLLSLDAVKSVKSLQSTLALNALHPSLALNALHPSLALEALQPSLALQALKPSLASGPRWAYNRQALLPSWTLRSSHRFSTGPCNRRSRTCRTSFGRSRPCRPCHGRICARISRSASKRRLSWNPSGTSRPRNARVESEGTRLQSNQDWINIDTHFPFTLGELK